MDWIDTRTAEDLINYFNDKIEIHGYFKNFKIVSKFVFNNFGKDYGTAHNDIVKCSSMTFPPETAKGKNAKIVINNCKKFLEEQIKQNKPKIIICNGAEVSKFMLNFLPPQATHTEIQTSYWSNIDGAKICVILSGFIGRIDNYAKRRLGIEIEGRISEIQTSEN